MSAKKKSSVKLSKRTQARKSAKSGKAVKPGKGRRATPATKPSKLAKPKRADKTKKKKPAKARKVVVRRRDSAGHIDPQYAAELLAQSGIRRGSDSDAFLVGSRSNDPLAEGLGEEFVETATSGEDEAQDVINEQLTEERGGPFVVSPSGTEFAGGTDASNPKGSTREPFPRS
jgi:hypothetical protein